MDNEKGPEVAAPLQEQIDGLVEAVNDDDLLEVLSGLRSLEGEQLNLAHSSTGFSPLQSAVFEQHHLRKLIVHLLLAKGASYKKGDQNAIELSRQCGNEEIFELLREWDRGKRAGDLPELVRYLLTLTDEEAIAWREQTIAEEQQREEQLDHRDHSSASSFKTNPTTHLADPQPPKELQAVNAAARSRIPNDDLASLPPRFINHELRSKYYTQLPPISTFHHLVGPPPVYTAVIRLDDIRLGVTQAQVNAFVSSVIPPSSIAKITFEHPSNGWAFSIIYLNCVMEISRILTSFTFSALGGISPRAVIALPTLFIEGWPFAVDEGLMHEFLLSRGCNAQTLVQPSERHTCFATFASVAEAEEAFRRLDGALYWGKDLLRARWCESVVRKSYDSTLSHSTPQAFENADLATFTSRVSQLGWRSAVQQYTRGEHAHLPALEAEAQLAPSLPSSQQPFISSAHPFPQLASTDPPKASPDILPSAPPQRSATRPPWLPVPLFVGLLKPNSHFLLSSLCQGLLGHSLRDAALEPSTSHGDATVVRVVLASQEERKALVKQLTELELGGKRICVGFTRQEVDERLRLALNGSLLSYTPAGARYPTPETPRASSMESSSSA
ncbi:hypothetical protein BCR35DRAFT_332405 [Leucosporidium creatinivorum]|uniref:RRM domain-containing protein n=1 Tax=Leucosporidium creatinivorum TaxID=106004 RepID=A0A1Y2F3H2_9BASI|nr:hypothetical protein BCR35DRAFT_332405 [Leucosporidium creatinivorum]